MYDFDPNGLELKQGVPVIVDTQKGLEYGICAGAPRDVEDEHIVPPLRKVERLATEEDTAAVRNQEEKEQQAGETFRKRAEAHKLVMKLVDVEYAFDNTRIIFFFTADGRVDFRDLVKDLASIFRTRIELRQVGVRDEAKMVGGLGICGRPFCCAEFLSEFQPVSIKMAKEQSLSLNPAKISGTCGRLMCCLKYEQDAYEDLLANTPKVDSVVQTPMGPGVVTDVSLLRGNLSVRLDEAPETPKVFHKSELGEGRPRAKPTQDAPSANRPPQERQSHAGPHPARNGFSKDAPRRGGPAPESAADGAEPQNPPRPAPPRNPAPRQGQPPRSHEPRPAPPQQRDATPGKTGKPQPEEGKPPLKPRQVVKPFAPKQTGNATEQPERQIFKHRPPKHRRNRDTQENREERP